MFNLLPKNLKEKIKAEYKIRLLIVIFIFVIFTQMLFAVFLFPSWLVSYQKEKEVLAETENLNQNKSGPDADSTASIIALTNLKLNIINTVLKYPEAALFLETIIKSKTPGVSLYQFIYTSTGGSGANISVSGLSLNRQDLVLFAKNLSDSAKFRTVDLPVSNLTKDKDLSFSINLDILKP